MRIQHQFPLYYPLFLLFLATTTLISPSLGDLGRCHPSDFKAIMKMKSSLTLNMSDLEYSSWFTNTDCCQWNGITCDDNTNRVISIFLLFGEISGQIPSSLGDLPHLLVITFTHFKNITGSIPQSITKLKHLVRLDLSRLILSGPLPNFLAQITTLTFLDLSDNKFYGSIPPNLADLKDITHINLGGNKLTGDASMLFNGSSTISIILSRNQFVFDLTKIKFAKDLTWLDISHNKIFGGIPDEIKKLDSLYTLKVGYNRLCGKIPTGGIMKRFKSTSFFHNKCLCGSPLKISCKKE